MLGTLLLAVFYRRMILRQEKHALWEIGNLVSVGRTACVMLARGKIVLPRFSLKQGKEPTTGSVTVSIYQANVLWSGPCTEISSQNEQQDEDERQSGSTLSAAAKLIRAETVHG